MIASTYFSTQIRLLLAIFFFTLGACSSLPKDIQRVPSFTLEDTSGTYIAKQLQPILDSHPELSGFHVLGDGVEAFAARIRLIDLSEASIDTQYYIWHDDLTGKAMYHRLLAAADRGVRVRILLDDLDTAGKEQMLHAIDAHPKIEIRLFNPFANRNHRVLDFATDTRRVNRRMHIKTITFDNRASIFGGRNVGDEYFGAAKDVGFGDMDALAIGPIATEVSSQFDLYWNSQWVYPLSAFTPDSPVTEDVVVAFRAQSDADQELATRSAYRQVFEEAHSAQAQRFKNAPFAWSRWMLAYDQPSKVDAKKVTEETHLAPQLKKGMDNTESDLIIVSPYFVPGTDVTAYLTGLVERGVRVRILTNSLAANDVSLVHAGYMRYRKDLIAGGVELYEFKATRNIKLEKKKRKNRIGASRASLHAKFFGFDERFMFIGSFNLDGRSTSLNTELGAYFESPKHATELSRIFSEDVQLIAYRLELDEDGDIFWTTRFEDGTEVRVDKEPDTTGWKRFSTRVMSWIVPESQL